MSVDNHFHLERCPFCKNNARIDTDYNEIKGKFLYTVICTNEDCECLLNKMKDTPEEAVDAWNKCVSVGEWIVLESDEESSLCECSICKEWHTFYSGEYLPSYCPSCGSKNEYKSKGSNSNENEDEYGQT